MNKIAGEAMRDHVRFHLTRYASKGTRADVTPELIGAIETLREAIREDEGGGGMCGIVVEELSEALGWSRMAVACLSDGGEVICCPHFVSILSDGTIVDSTADQLGEGASVVVVSPGEAGYGRYRPEFSETYNPDTHPDELAAWSETWDGEMDDDAFLELALERGFGWWLDDVSALTDFCRRQLELCEATGGRSGYEDYLRDKLRDLDARAPQALVA